MGTAGSSRGAHRAPTTSGSKHALVATLAAFALLVPLSSHAALYAVVGSGVVFESANDGVTWVVRGNIPEPEVVALSPGLASGTLFALGETGTVYRSPNGGASWAAVGAVTASDCVSLAIARSGALLALTRSGDVHRSSDDGASWSRESNAGASDCAAIAVGGKTGASDTLFIATASGDIARLPSGTAWTTIGTTSFTPVVDLLWVSSTLYALTDAGEILRSSNAGATWSAIGTISQVGMRDLAYVGGKFKAMSREGEVYESADGSAWSDWWVGTTNQVFAVALAPGAPEFQTGVGDGAAPNPQLAFRAYPNPFTSELRFSLASADGAKDDARAEIAVYDAAGRLVARPFSGALNSLPQNLVWRADAAGSGVYFVRVRSDRFAETQRLVKLR
ncbi:MAG: T9SS type A sorting domain-containing protein [bacterium]